MSIDEFVNYMSTDLSYGPRLFQRDGIAIAYRVIDWDYDSEIVRLRAVGDNRIEEQHVSLLTHIEGDVCACGELGCEWHTTITQDFREEEA